MVDPDPGARVARSAQVEANHRLFADRHPPMTVTPSAALDVVDHRSHLRLAHHFEGHGQVAVAGDLEHALGLVPRPDYERQAIHSRAPLGPARGDEAVTLEAQP